MLSQEVRWRHLKNITAGVLIAASSIVFIAVAGHYIQQRQQVNEMDKRRVEWTQSSLEHEIGFNQFMQYGMAFYVGGDPALEKGQITAENVKALEHITLRIAVFTPEPMQIESMDMEYQIYQITPGKKTLVYSQPMPYPAQSLEPNTFYDYTMQVDYWEQGGFESGQIFSLQVDHADTCPYHLTESDSSGKIDLANVVEGDQYIVKIK